MARTRRQLTDEQRSILVTMGKSGASAAAIARELGGVVSESTVKRRLREVRGPQRSPRIDRKPSSSTKPKRKTKTSKPSAPSLEVGGVEDLDAMADLDALLREIDDLGSEAKEVENVAQLAAAKRLKLQAIALREKLRPPPPPDPEELPSFVATANRCRAKLHEMVQRELDKRGDNPPCHACGRPMLHREASA